MELGQTICFDDQHHSGVYQRVMDKAALVEQLYRQPELVDRKQLEHHTKVAIRELALEEVRREQFPQSPSRMACLYVSKTPEQAGRWGEYFCSIGRPTYSLVKLIVRGNCFVGDAANCFDATLNHEENLRLAKHYWQNLPNSERLPPIEEMLVDGEMEVVEIIQEYNANLSQP